MYKYRRKGITTRIFSALLVIALIAALCPTDIGYVMAEEAVMITVSGEVSDHGGLGLAGVTITVYNDASEVLGTTTTDSEGNYTVGVTGTPSVVSATKEDYKKSKYNITDTTTGIDFVLEEKAEQTVSFDVANTSVVMGGTLTKTATVSVGEGEVKYSSGATNIATVDENTGIVTPVSVGITIITATCAATDDYKMATDQYTLTVTKATQNSLTWSIAQENIPTNLTWKDVYANTVTGGSGKGAVTYSTSDEDVAAVDANTGIVTLKTPGTVIITATKADDGFYSEQTASYTLTVNKAKRKAHLAETVADTISTGETYTIEVLYDAGEAPLSINYSSSDDICAEVNSSGEILGGTTPGTATITVTIPADELYEETVLKTQIEVINPTSSTDFRLKKGTVDKILYVGETYVNPAINGTGTVSYSSSEEDVATISDGTVTAKSAGVTTIIVSDGSTTLNYDVEVKAAGQSVTFADTTSVKSVSLGDTYENIATAHTTVKYSSSDSTIATVDENTGVVTPIKAGSVIITATAIAETDKYEEAHASYALHVNAKTQTVSFAEENVTVTYNDNNNEFTQTADSTAASAIGNSVTYSVESGNATVDGNGKVKIKGAGTIVIKATYSGNEEYSSASATYTITVNKSNQTIGFPQNEFTVTIGQTFTASVATETSEKYGTGTITYEKTEDAASVLQNFNTTNGTFTLTGNVGSATIKATKAADGNYKAATATYTFTVQKKQQAIAFPATSYTVFTGGSFLAPVASVTSAEFTNNAIVYTIKEDTSGIISNLNADTGSVVLNGNVGTATIKATKPGDANFDDATATYTLTVQQWTADNTMYTIEDTTGLEGNVWFKGAVSIKAANGYQIKLDGTGEWATEKQVITDDTSASNISFYVKKIDQGYISDKVTESIKKDGTVPTVTINCEGRTLWDKLLSFFRDDYNKEYKIISSDATSGVQRVEYYIDTDNTVIKTAEQLDAITTWTTYDPVNFIDVAKGNKYVVYAKVTDNAGNYVYTSTNGIVHDIANPIVTFEASSDGSKYTVGSTDIYSDDIRLKIKVEDPAPYSGIKSVSWKVYNDGTEVVSDSYTPENTGDVAYADLENTFQKILELNKEVYTGDTIRVRVEVEDFSGNTTVREKIYAISSDIPVINISFDNNEAARVEETTGYFEESRTATVEISCSSELFDADEATEGIKITAKDSRNENVSLDANTISNWVSNGDNHRATISFSKDANYTLEVSYKNKLNQTAVVTYAEGTLTPNSFAVDTTAPTIAVAYTDGDSSPMIVGEKGYFKGTRIATITIDEKTTFVAGDVSISITAKDSEGNAVLTSEECKNLVSDFHITSDNKYQATIEYDEDANYTFDIQYADRAGHIANVNMGSSVTPKNFVVDTEKPKGKIKVGQEWNWDTFLEIISFGLYNSNQPKTVTIESSDVTSGVESVHYHKTTTSEIKTKEELETINELFWTEYETSFEIAPNSKVIVYARIIDKLGHTTYLCTNGIILEDESPVVTEKVKPEVTLTPEAGTNVVYSSDVKVAVEVSEPTENDMFSGLQWVKYEVSSLGTKTQEGVLYQLPENTNDFVVDWESTEDNADSYITVDSSLNHSNSVVVKVIACDRAGNIGVATLNLKIDKTAPQISVIYDNNDGETSGDTTYFNKARTATITIKENNFDPAKVSVNGSSNAALQWTSSADNANGDGGVHRASITFATDGDYTFGISCVDRAGHTSSNVDYGSSLAPTNFTVDVTAPQVTVSYDNNNAVNGNYYKEARVGTIQVKEHNFDASGVNFQATATDDDQPVELPRLSNWVSNGDIHTATVVYDKDALYTFDFDYTDKAGNKAADLPMDTFYVDKTAPSVSITNIVDESANNGEGNIGFSITATDTNFDIFTPVLTAVVKEGDKFVEKQISGGGFSNIRNGQVFTIRNVEADGIYRIACTVIDKAGNAYTEVSLQHQDGSAYVEQRSAEDTLVTFSVNRQGSTYELDESTMEIVKQYYVQNVNNDVVLVEVNTNTLKEYKVTLNGKELKEGTDYTVTTEGGYGEWMKYTYAIKKSFFENEGQYQIVVSSKDEADNNAFSDVKGATVTFVVDRTAPVVTVTGLETNGRYQVERQVVTIIPTDDGGALNSLLVRIVDEGGKELEKLVDLSGDELMAALDENDGKITFEIEEGLYQNVQIICNDCSMDSEGNTNTYNMTFYQVAVSSSALKILFASKGVRNGTIGGMVLITGGVGVLIFRRRKIIKR